MLRNSAFYRRWWYIRKRNLKKMNLMVRLAIAAFFIWLLYLFIMNLYSILPKLMLTHL